MKKTLSLFIISMALMIFAVGCSNDTTAPTVIGPQATDAANLQLEGLKAMNLSDEVMVQTTWSEDGVLLDIVVKPETNMDWEMAYAREDSTDKKPDPRVEDESWGGVKAMFR